MNNPSTSLTPAAWVRQQIGPGSISWHTFVKMMGFVPAASGKYAWSPGGDQEARALLIERLGASGYDLSGLPFEQLVSGKTTVREVAEPPRKGQGAANAAADTDDGSPAAASPDDASPEAAPAATAKDDAAGGATPEGWLAEMIGQRPIDWHTFQKLFAYVPAARERNHWPVDAMRAVRAALLDRLRDSGYDISRLPYQELVNGKKAVTEVTPPERGGQAPSRGDTAAAPPPDPDDEAMPSATVPAASAPRETTDTSGRLPVPETLARSLYRATEEVLRRALALEQRGDFDEARKLVTPQITRIRQAVPQLRQDDPQANREIIAYLQDKLDRYDRGTLPGAPAQPGVTAHQYNNTKVPLPATPAVTAPKPGNTTPKPGSTTPKPGATTPGAAPKPTKAVLTPQQWVQRQIGTRVLTWQDFGKQMGFTHQAQTDHQWSDPQLTWVREQLIKRVEQSGYEISNWLRNELITNNTPFSKLEEPPRSGTGAARGNYKALINRYFGSNALLAEAIMRLESSGDPEASNTNDNGSIDTGLWQINSVHWSKVPGSSNAEKIKWLQDAEHNAKMAVQISGGGQNWLPWSTYKKHVPGNTLAEKAAWLKQPGNKERAAARVISAAGLGQTAGAPSPANSRPATTGTSANPGTTPPKEKTKPSVPASGGSKFTKLTLHHSASPKDTTTMADILAWHKKRGFVTYGYHYILVPTNGRLVLHAARPDTMTGAHVKGHNTRNLGVCVPGHYDKEYLTPQEYTDLIRILKQLMQKYGISVMYGHRELTSTACPGAHMNLGKIRKDLGLA